MHSVRCLEDLVSNLSMQKRVEMFVSLYLEGKEQIQRNTFFYRI